MSISKEEGNKIYIKAITDGNYYRVERGPHSQIAADLLGKLNLKIETLITYLVQNYSRSQYPFIYKLQQRFSYVIISENAIPPINSKSFGDGSSTSYALDKKQVFMCLKTRDVSENPYDENLLTYIVLHEVSHLCNDTEEEEHGRDFQMIFRFLTNTAVKLKLYNFIDYSINPVNYCGLTLNTQILNQ